MTIFALKIKQEMAAQELPNISIELLRQNFSATGNLQNDFLTLQTMDEDEEAPWRISLCTPAASMLSSSFYV